MTILIDINHETEDFSQYTTTVTDGGDLHISTSGFGDTSHGLGATIDDTVAIYGQKTITSSTTGFANARFYLYPNTLTMLNTENVSVFELRNSTNIVAVVYLEYLSLGGGYTIKTAIVSDAGTYTNTSNYIITDAIHYIEIQLARATTSISSDGSLELLIDGVSKETISGIDNYDRFNALTNVRIGATAFSGTPTGVLHLDELVVTDTADNIGANTSEIRVTDVGINVEEVPESEIRVTNLGTSVEELPTSEIRITNLGIQVEYIPVVSLSYGSISVQGQVITISGGGANPPITLNLDYGLITITGSGIDIIPGAVTISLDYSNITVSGNKITIIPGTISIGLDSGLTLLTGNQITVVPGLVSVGLDYGLITSSGIGITISAIEQILIALNSGLISASGISISIIPGTAIVLFDSGIVNLTGNILTLIVDRFLSLNPGAIVVTTPKLTVIFLEDIYGTRDLTLLSRIINFTLNTRDTDFTLINRDTNFTIIDRDTDFTLLSRYITFILKDNL